MSTNVRSASYPTSIRPLRFMFQISAGPEHIHLTTCSIVHLPWLTWLSINASEFSTAGKPDGHFGYGSRFSSMVWGAWSVATMSITPSHKACQSCSLSVLFLIDGFILTNDPKRG